MGDDVPMRKTSNELQVRVNGHHPRRGSIRVLLSETSKALGLPFDGEGPETPEIPLNNRVFQFQRQATNSSLNVPYTANSIASSQGTGKEPADRRRCCSKKFSRLFAHSVLIVIMGLYVLMGTLLYVLVIGPVEQDYELRRTPANFDVDDVMMMLKKEVLKNDTAGYANLDYFRSYLKHRVESAGVYVNKRDYSAVSGMLYSISVIGGIGIGNPPRTEIGKATTFSYCFFGMPLYFLFLYVIGDDVGKLIAVLYHSSSFCSMCRHRAKSAQARQFMAASPDVNEGYRRIQACIPVSLMLVIIAFYVLLAVLMFGLWENWDAINSIYFCVLTLMSVGLIDEIPGDNIDHRLTSVTTHIRRSLVIVYIICGWLLLAALYHAVSARIDMQKKKRNFKLSQQSRTTSMIFRTSAASNPNF